MLEIGAMYLIYMSRGKNSPFYKIDLFGGEDQLVRKLKIGRVRCVEMHG